MRAYLRANPDIARLQAVKVLRSLGQGALVVTFSLYLDSLGWQAHAIGLLLAAGGLLNAVLSVPIGIASDRLGRKSFVIVNEMVIVVAAILAVSTSHATIVAIAGLLGAFGRGQVGMVGPAAPAEQAWLAELIEPSQRGRIYSNNAALGFLGMGIGAVIAGLIPLWASLLPGPLAYRPLFVIVLVSGIANLALLATTRGGGAPGRPRPGVGAAGGTTSDPPASRKAPVVGPAAFGAEAQIRRTENRRLLQLAAINAMNGIAIGLTSPLLSYWFAVKFGVGPGALGPVFAFSFFATAVASIATGRASERVGLVRSVVTVRLLAVIILVIIPLVPFFWLAAVLHVFRSALSRGSQGARQALTVALVRDERRGFASSMNSISMSIPNSVGPTIAGYLLSAGQLSLPFYVAAAMQFGYGVLFGRFFQGIEPEPRAKPKTPVKASG